MSLMREKSLERRDDMLRRNERGELGTRTATLARAGLAKVRENWVYRVKSQQ